MKRLLLITTALVTAVAPVSQALASASLYTQEQPDERDLAQGPRDRGRGDGGGRRPRPDNPSPPPQPPSPVFSRLAVSGANSSERAEAP